MDVHEFHRALGASLDALDRARHAEEQVQSAERRFAAKQAEIAALADAHAALQKQSDEHLQANLSRMHDERQKHEAAVAELQRNQFALAERNKQQITDASEALANVNAGNAIARKDRDDLLIELSRLRGQVQDIAARIG